MNLRGRRAKAKVRGTRPAWIIRSWERRTHVKWLNEMRETLDRLRKAFPGELHVG